MKSTCTGYANRIDAFCLECAGRRDCEAVHCSLYGSQTWHKRKAVEWWRAPPCDWQTLAQAVRKRAWGWNLSPEEQTALAKFEESLGGQAKLTAAELTSLPGLDPHTM